MNKGYFLFLFLASPVLARGPSDPFPANLTLVPCDNVWPARHDTNSGAAQNPPFGMRVRMKASVDLSVLSDTHSICIFNAVKKYGLMLADNGGDWYIDGVPNVNWNDTTLHNDFINVGLPSATMEVVDAQAWAVDPVNLATIISSRAYSCPAVTPPSYSDTLNGNMTMQGKVTIQ